MPWREFRGRGYLEAAVHLSTLPLAFMPLLGMRPMVLAIVVWLTLLAIRFIRDRPSLDRRSGRWVLLLSAPFLLMLVDLLRAPDPLAAWHIVETSSPLLLFPVGFLLLGAPSTERTRHAMMDLLSFSALLLATWANIRVIMAGNRFMLDAGTIITGPGYRAEFAEASGMHPPYAAYFFLTGALFQIQQVLDAERIPRWRVAMVLLLVLSAGMIASRMPLIAFAASAAFLIGRHLSTSARLRLAVAIVASLIVMALGLPTLRDRSLEAFHTSTALPSQADRNSVNERSAILNCTLGSLEEHWIFGMGQSAVQPALDECYGSLGLTGMQTGSYSTHDQPLHWWLSFGLLGLAAFISIFAFPLRAALRHRDGAHAAFLVFMLLCCLTENVLARQWGVTLFACFNALFIATHPRGDLTATAIIANGPHGHTGG